MRNISICVWNINGVQNKFLSNDAYKLFIDKEILIIVETHFGIRTKCPRNFVLIARSKIRESKKARGGVALYKRADSTLSLKVMCEDLFDTLVIEVENTPAIFVATYIPPNNTNYYTDIYYENLRIILDTFIFNKKIYIFGDMNSRIKNDFPHNNFQYRINPDQYCNQNGRQLIDILREFKDLLIVNGICYNDRIMDSNFTFFRGSRTSQIDFVLCNCIDTIKTFKIHDKLPQSDHCPCSVEILSDSSPPIEIIDECARCFNSYVHVDINRRIKSTINLKRLDLRNLDNSLQVLGNEIWDKYVNTYPSQKIVDDFYRDISDGIYNCCLENKNSCGFDNRQPTQQNCSSRNFRAIAEAHYTRYIDLIEVNNELAYHHKEEWLFYQHTAWEKEQEEISKFKGEKWNLYYKKDPKKLWNMLDWKGKIKSAIAGPPNLIHSYFDKIFNAVKIQKNPLIKESKHEVQSYKKFNDVTDKQFDHADLNYAIAKIGKGTSFDGLPGRLLQFLPQSLLNSILLLYQCIFGNIYPSQWRNQLLLPVTKKGHETTNPKLRGIAIGPLFSRVFDIIVNKRFCTWYSPNPEQAGFRQHQGCLIQIFALFITMSMAIHLSKSLYIGLLDFEKAFDFMNRPSLLRDLMNKGIGSMFLDNLYNMYEKTFYVPKISENVIGEQIPANHGIAQGKNSSCNIFSFYMSDMKDSVKDMNVSDFTEPNNMLQLADDTLIISEHTHSLAELFVRIFNYAKRKFIIINMDKTKYMQLTEYPSLQNVVKDDISIEAVNPDDGYNWLGFYLSYTSNVNKLIENNFKKKAANIGKFYAWLQINETTPFPLKLRVLYSCMLPALLYSCEAWGALDDLEKRIMLIEKKALKACLGVKQGTSDEIIYLEINKADIVASIYYRQYKFYQKFKRLSCRESTARNIWQSYTQDRNQGEISFINHYETLNADIIRKNMCDRKSLITISNKSMHKRYIDLFNLEYNDILYNSMINDKDRKIITRWRLSSHHLYIETGRYKNPPVVREERKCVICEEVEDEEHALLKCRAHEHTRNIYSQLLLKYPGVRTLLNPQNVDDINRIARYLREIEKNMKTFKLVQ